MIAIDTDILIRIVVADDADQAQRARHLVETQEVYMAKSVLLEAEWVLRSFYGYSRPDILRALQGVLRLPRVVAEDRPGAVRSLQLVANGMDFADALHLVSARDCETLASFDLKFARVAVRNGTLRVWEP
jgi:predicted nucleic-acid-binding protein